VPPGSATEPTPDQHEPLPPADPESAARAICLRLLALQPRTRAELAAALESRGVPADAAAAVLSRFDEVGLIDDTAFADAWVETRHRGRGLGRRALVARRLPASRGLATPARVRRLVGMLARKGYPPGLSIRVVRAALAEEGAVTGGELDALDAMGEG